MKIISDYYKILGLPEGSTEEEIKKAYRKRAREFHPDLNHSGSAMDMFILVTEAYEFLITNLHSKCSDGDRFEKATQEWNKNNREKARKRAETYARASYTQFINTKFYKTTRLLDGTTIIFSLIIAVGVVFFAVYGYVWRLKYSPADEEPSIGSFIMLLSLGVIFLIISGSFLREYLIVSKRHKKRHTNGKIT